MEHGLLYYSNKMLLRRNQVLFTLSNPAVSSINSSTCHMFTYHSTRTSHAHIDAMPTYAQMWSTQTCCATAAVPWLPQNRELESLRHGVVQA